MLQNVAAHHGLHCLPLIQWFLDTTYVLGSILYLVKFYNKYGKELCPNYKVKYSVY